jgi:transcriptional regulator of heat shock response
MADRKNNLLKMIIEEYIRSAMPVSSGLINEKYLPRVSSATIRNDMAELEEAGLIYQPHTSAGRVPTLAGYQYYLDNFVFDSEIHGPAKEELEKLSGKIFNNRLGAKDLAKTLAEISSATVLVGFSPRDVYYTGISNLFRQPEFSQYNFVYSMSQIIDHLDEVMSRIFDQIDKEIKIWLGSDNPFGEMSSVILSKITLDKQKILLGILGPNRMDYQKNIGLIRYSQQLFK